MADETLKTCACCKQAKPLSDFPKKAANKDGLYSYCKPCNSRKSAKDPLDFAREMGRLM